MNEFEVGYEDLSFEWDEEKRQAVWEKHGIDLPKAARIFDYPEVLSSYPDLRHDYSEPRWHVMGCVEGVWYELVVTKRDKVIRLITGWKLNERSKRKAEARHARTITRDG